MFHLKQKGPSPVFHSEIHYDEKTEEDIIQDNCNGYDADRACGRRAVYRIIRA